jgi:hypothetical protein
MNKLPDGERIQHSSPGATGNKPRCHVCNHPHTSCHCNRFDNGPKAAVAALPNTPGGKGGGKDAS